jgi:hypothetical protein
MSLTIDGYPIVDATRIALETTRQFLEKDQTVCLVVAQLANTTLDLEAPQCGERLPLRFGWSIDDG